MNPSQSKKAPKIISISGLDGSGKSTQVELLKKHLERRKKKVFYFHAIQFSIVNKIVRLLKSPFKFFGIIKEKEGQKPKSVTKASKWQIKLRKFILEIDMGRFETLLRNLSDCGYDYVVSDRYFYDNIINIEYLSAKLENGTHKNETSRFKKEVAKIKPDIAIYLQTDPQEIIKRDDVPEQGIVYLELKKKLYDKRSKLVGWKVVDGNRKIKTIYQEIKEIVKKELNLP